MAAEPVFLGIKDLRPGLKNLNIIFIVLEIGKPNRTKDGHDVRSCKVADKSGSINISVWDEAGDLLQTGDICRLTKGYASMWKGSLTLYTGKGGDIHKIGEFCMQFTETPNWSEPNPDHLSKLQDPQSNHQASSQPLPGNNGSNGQRRSPTDTVGGPGSGAGPGETGGPVHMGGIPLQLAPSMAPSNGRPGPPPPMMGGALHHPGPNSVHNPHLTGAALNSTRPQFPNDPRVRAGMRPPNPVMPLGGNGGNGGRSGPRGRR